MSRIPVCTTTFKLNNGHDLPAVGLGTYQGKAGTSETETIKNSIIHALKHGYRMIDTAQFYGVESIVGEAIRDSGIPRPDITVITKLWGTRFHDPAAALADSLRDLDIGYIDIFLMHWPNAMTVDQQPQYYPGDPPYWETWKSMERLVGDKCRGVGVSNFTPKLLDRLLQDATIPPAVNEVELHALNPNLKLVPYCLDKNIRVISWSTLGSELLGGKNPILTHSLFTEIAKKHGCSTGVVSLSWAVQRGVVVIPKSSKLNRIEENIHLVQLDQSEIQTLNEAYTKIERVRLSELIPEMQYKMPDGRDTILGWTKQDFGWEDDKGNWLC